MTTQDILDHMTRCRQQLLDALVSVKDSDWTRPTLLIEGEPTSGTAWTLKDLLAHLASTDRSMTRLLEGVLDASYTVEQGQQFDLNRWNASQVARRRETPVSELMAEMAQNRDQLRSLIAQLSDDHLKSRVWRPFGGESQPPGEYDLETQLIFYAEHDLRHLPDIQAALQR